MTFSVTVPNSTQSPGLFPAQNNTNFQRIKDIVNNDHNWTDSASASQGIHKQATFINRSAPGSLPAGNGILYSAADTSGASQLNWYNGSSNVQITPGVQLITGSASINSGNATATIFANPGYAYQGYLWIGGDGTTTPICNGIVGRFSNSVTFFQCTQPTLIKASYSGQDLIVTNTNPGGGPFSAIWTLEVNRLP